MEIMKGKIKYIEITYHNNLYDTKERKCIMMVDGIGKKEFVRKLVDFDKHAPNRIITNIEILYSIIEIKE